MQSSVSTPTSSISWSSFYQNEILWIALLIAVSALSYSEWFCADGQAMMCQT